MTMLDIEEEEEDEGEAKCPLYICIYICRFLSISDWRNVFAVSRKWAAAMQQIDMLHSYLDFNNTDCNAECINIYLTPLFDTILALANSPLQIRTVADHATAIVKAALEGEPKAAQLAKQEDEVRNFVHNNCKLFYKTNPTAWMPESPWNFEHSYYDKSDEANSDMGDDSDEPDLEDDGFRYNFYGDDDGPGVNRFSDKEEEGEEMEDMGYYRGYPDESEREIARTREELGYLSLH
eukprot:Phypoly_transcript_11474.p1 GENE.Phypoly_transcript_11474~~Phypoly_transcript_11474.p1  ORF type:complete len:236 (+),score=56.43 Phypoly_transcript_11474:85-792(+)